MPVLLAVAGQTLLSRPGPPQLPEDSSGADGLTIQLAEEQQTDVEQPAVSAADTPLPGLPRAVESDASRPAPEPAPAEANSTSSRSRTVPRPVTSRQAPAPVGDDDDDDAGDDDGADD